ncbi:MAG: polyphosphate kinase 1 [Phycisphaerales bacterium]
MPANEPSQPVSGGGVRGARGNGRGRSRFEVEGDPRSDVEGNGMREALSGLAAPVGVQGPEMGPMEAKDAAARSSLRPDVRPNAKTLNRDLSWLEFNARVLFQAQDERLPLLERTRFLAIFTSNLDEFVMKRVGWLKRAVDAKLDATDDGLSPSQLLAAVRATFEHLEEQQAYCFDKSIRPALAKEGIELLGYGELTASEREWIEVWYRRYVFPVLTPLAVDPGHRFPFISNLSANLGVLLVDADPKPDATNEPLFARVKVPQGMPQWVRVPMGPDDIGPGGANVRRGDARSGRGRFVQLHEVIRHNLDDLFPGMKITEVMPFRVTRAAEGGQAEQAGDIDNLLDFVEAQIKRRRFASVVRLELAREASARLVKQVVEMFKIKAEDTDLSQGLLEFRSLFEIADLPRADLKNPVWTPVVPPRLAEMDKEDDIFARIRGGDILVHHPYESFQASAERFIAAAALDPAVLAIKQTIYRTSRDSPFVGHLIRAAEAGKQVACLVELQARFDEGRNVRLAQSLEKAGVHVAYGVLGLKTHCKASLVVRREEGGLRSYAHIGTGNYNPATAQLYTDLGLFTCDPTITEDVVDLFNLLTGRSKKKDYRKLLVAPAAMKNRFVEMIQREAKIAKAHAAGESAVGGLIVAKMNALEDAAITRELYRAAQAGVRIKLFVRGFCCLRPGIAGFSENISVVSVVGRFLEHSRIFHFGAGQADPLEGEWFIGSADWMYRNLERRVEACCPVIDRAGRAKLHRLLQVMSEDRRNAWDLRPDGRYSLRTPDADALPDSPAALGTFGTFMREAMGG